MESQSPSVANVDQKVLESVRTGLVPLFILRLLATPKSTSERRNGAFIAAEVDKGLNPSIGLLEPLGPSIGTKGIGKGSCHRWLASMRSGSTPLIKEDGQDLAITDYGKEIVKAVSLDVERLIGGELPHSPYGHISERRDVKILEGLPGAQEALRLIVQSKIAEHANFLPPETKANLVARMNELLAKRSFAAVESINFSFSPLDELERGLSTFLKNVTDMHRQNKSLFERVFDSLIESLWTALHVGLGILPGMFFIYAQNWTHFYLAYVVMSTLSLAAAWGIGSALTLLRNKISRNTHSLKFANRSSIGKAGGAIFRLAIVVIVLYVTANNLMMILGFTALKAGVTVPFGPIEPGPIGTIFVFLVNTLLFSYPIIFGFFYFEFVKNTSKTILGRAFEAQENRVRAFASKHSNEINSMIKNFTF